MAPADALERWHDFYVLVGTAAATLVALLFVAISLGAGYLSAKRTAPTRAFFSPVVVHFTAILMASALALAPEHAGSVVSVVIGAIAIIGLAVSLFSTVQLLRNRWTNYLQDHLCYGVLPAICYGALFVASWMILMEKDAALDVLAAALLFLLAVNIRNAWDLTLSMVHHQTEREQARRRRPSRSK
jgi:hypothetical protein